MLKVILTVSALVLSVASVQAGPLPVEKRMAAKSSAQRYWLSDGLNRLVFWKSAGDTQRDERRSN